MRYDPNNFDHKMRVLKLAATIVGHNTLGSAARWDIIKNLAKDIEAEFQSAPPPKAKTESERHAELSAERRKAFLDSISTTCCGNGRDDCDGSEGTCTCQ